VGSIGTSGGLLVIGDSDCGIAFEDGSTNHLYPWNVSGGAVNDGNINLGASFARFKDLYLSGSIHGDVKFENNAGTTEYARFDSSGNLLVGTTSNLNMGANNIQGVDIGSAGTILASATAESALHVGRQSSFGSVVTFACMGTADVGSIDVTTSATSYTTSSDHRLKENVVDLTGATDRLKQLEPRRFNFIADADTTVDGFLAHEVQSVVPEAITGTHNEVDADGNPVYQGIDQSKLVPLLVKTIQELEARITALENA
jgi:hypothetical protein